MPRPTEVVRQLAEGANGLGKVVNDLKRLGVLRMLHGGHADAAVGADRINDSSIIVGSPSELHRWATER